MNDDLTKEVSELTDDFMACSDRIEELEQINLDLKQEKQKLEADLRTANVETVAIQKSQQGKSESDSYREAAAEAAAEAEASIGKLKDELLEVEEELARVEAERDSFSKQLKLQVSLSSFIYLFIFLKFFTFFLFI